jgi:serine/threonine protein kinase
LDILHRKVKVFHGDIKTDNILLKGINNKNKTIIKLYNDKNFNDLYSKSKREYCDKFKKNILKLESSKKIKIRTKIHDFIYNNLKDKIDEIKNNDIDDKYINDCSISLSDFGSFVEDGEYYDESFGTMYYRSPENILVGKSSFPNDVWALGCTFYEILTGKILFEPDKDKEFNRVAHHLKLINELCGNFDLSFLKTTNEWKDYFNKNGKLKIEIEHNYRGKFENDLVNIVPSNELENMIKLLKNMLIINPKERWSCSKCLEFMKKNLY